jgi:hypothetical protein
MRYLAVDGMLSGTGIRDSVEGGYVDPAELGVSEDLRRRIGLWLIRYADAHYAQFEDSQVVAELDTEGVAICRQLRDELPQSKITYFSNAEMRDLTMPPPPDSPPSTPRG